MMVIMKILEIELNIFSILMDRNQYMEKVYIFKFKLY